jgi:hypothetical protein
MGVAREPPSITHRDYSTERPPRVGRRLAVRRRLVLDCEAMEWIGW